MADNSITTSCINVLRYFSETENQGNKFRIPDYQRPYSWGEDEIKTLFLDIVDFIDQINEHPTNKDQKYFLGSVVTYNNNGYLELIDGQQRITSLFLLLRYMYESLKDSKEDSYKRLISNLESCLWQIDIAKEDFNKEDIIIESLAVSDSKRTKLKEILVTGKADKKDKNNYSKNYLLFQELFDDYCNKNKGMISTFVSTVLNKIILLPVNSNDEDFALRIFSTLNDRGMPLSDADIFKARCYGFQITDDDRKEFVSKWKKLEEDADDADVGLQSLFYYYMFYLRAAENDDDSTTPGLRKFYGKDEYRYLKDKNLLNNLNTSLNLWKVVNLRCSIENEAWSNNIEILKILDILNSYPNDFWKYPTNIYYLRYKNESDFESLFLNYLRRFASKLIKYFIEIPGISNIKVPVLKLNVDVYKTSNPTFQYFDKNINITSLKERIFEQNNKKFVRMILLCIAYNLENQKELIPTGWQIEHIFPQKWETSHFLTPGCGYDEKYVNNLIEHIGNKAPIEKIVNIMASNNYFTFKKKEYDNSKIAIIKDLKEREDWKISDIQIRDVNIVETLDLILKEWENNKNPDKSDGLLSKLLEEGKITKEQFNLLKK